jgi:S-adenosylmethionine:tRNA ribosyltransferase-isomerase
LLTADFNYKIPPELIAQKPLSPRDLSRLFVIGSKNFSAKQNLIFSHRRFRDLTKYLQPGDILVFNDSKVFPARLRGHKPTGGKIEVLLLEETSAGTWQALLKPGKGTENTELTFGENLSAQVLGRNQEVFELRFNRHGQEFTKIINKIGATPTPPYIKNPPTNLAQYQTIYAQKTGSAAAPTAGLHFSKDLLEKISNQGVRLEYVTLHVGLGTFQPVKHKFARQHKIHTERYTVKPDCWQRLASARAAGQRIIAVGTTSCRVLETIAANPNQLSGSTNIFIMPGFKFKMTDALITNFHLPQSTLLMLVTAFLQSKTSANQEKSLSLIHQIYATAIKRKYRFYSFGDAMFIQ